MYSYQGGTVHFIDVLVLFGLSNGCPLVFIPLKLVNVLERNLFLPLEMIDEASGDFRSLYTSDLMCYFC